MEDSQDSIALDPIPEQVRIRQSKREMLIKSGVDPYPVQVPRTHRLAEVRALYGALPPGAATAEHVKVAARVIHVRDSGSICFATLRDGDGTEVQLLLSRDRLGDERLEAWKRLVDIGDIVATEGEVVTTRNGELSIALSAWQMASKSLRPLPTSHKPMSDESRVRQRYLDLLIRPAARDSVGLRASVVHSLRETLDQLAFTEVETPMLQVQPGGATARPFVTRSNALGIDLYLRIAPELFLKRCVVGGLEAVYEVNRNFRNEGIDASHSPEFAMLEAYEAYSDYRGMAALTRRLVQNAAEAAFGSLVVTHVDGTKFDLSGDWREVAFFHALSDALDDEITPDTSVGTLMTHAAKRDLAFSLTESAVPNAGKVAEKIFDSIVAPTLREPTFVMDFPELSSPLTRHHRSTPGVAERWDLYALGFELATGYSELVDPVVQRERLVAQATAKAGGDDEAMRLDEDFLRAIEHGMPPCGGIGMGIDRLLMLLSGLSIRETILFPLVRPTSQGA